MDNTKRLENTLRKARTRTLIQAGALVNLVGLLELCDIEEGEDLQLDITSRDKAALLLGILSDAMAHIQSNPSQTDLNKWKETGIMLLKKATANRYYHDRFLHQS